MSVTSTDVVDAINEAGFTKESFSAFITHAKLSLDKAALIVQAQRVDQELREAQIVASSTHQVIQSQIAAVDASIATLTGGS